MSDVVLGQEAEERGEAVDRTVVPDQRAAVLVTLADPAHPVSGADTVRVVAGIERHRHTRNPALREIRRRDDPLTRHRLAAAQLEAKVIRHVVQRGQAAADGRVTADRAVRKGVGSAEGVEAVAAAEIGDAAARIVGDERARHPGRSEDAFLHGDGVRRGEIGRLHARSQQRQVGTDAVDRVVVDPDLSWSVDNVHVHQRLEQLGGGRNALMKRRQRLRLRQPGAHAHQVAYAKGAGQLGGRSPKP